VHLSRLYFLETAETENMRCHGRVPVASRVYGKKILRIADWGSVNNAVRKGGLTDTFDYLETISREGGKRGFNPSFRIQPDSAPPPLQSLPHSTSQKTNKSGRVASGIQSNL